MPNPRLKPHPLAFFSLKPLGKEAKDVVNDPGNRHLVSILNDGTHVLDVGFNIRSKSSNTLATLGRGETDIFVGGGRISKVQCSFEIDPDTHVIMFYDRSHGQTTQVYGLNCTPFEHGRIRKVLVQESLNTEIGMGGREKNLIRFELEWHRNPTETEARIKDRESLSQVENPRLARTVDDTETVLPSRMETRTHTPGPQQLKMRYRKVAELGVGASGTVHKAVNVDTGKYIAVKIIPRPKPGSKQEESQKLSVWYALKREVETLSRISHPHIVDYIASQGWDGPEIEIFMGLKQGTLRSLVEGGDVKDIKSLGSTVLHQMLQALDHLAVQGVAHRDVKPDNILYTRDEFQLGDFGLCNRIVSAKTYVGTPIYMAPEMDQACQTHKVDVWSLFVTMLWTLDIKGFRHQSTQFQSLPEVRNTILLASRDPNIAIIREMARVKPDERASAAQMLVKCFHGQGLTTPRTLVPDITPSSEASANKAPPPTVAQRRYQRTPRTQPSDRYRILNYYKTEEQFRIRKRPKTIRPKGTGSGSTENVKIPGAFPGTDDPSSG